jgi:hypothetical protein
VTIAIIGAGMAGLLAANLLRHRDPVIYEAASSLPNNHHAVLRFPTSKVGDAVGVPFRKVTMVKTAIPYINPVADVLAYAKKVGGVYSTGRSISTRSAEVGERWIAPPDFIERLASRVTIEYGVDFDFHPMIGKVISTIPMPKLMTALDYEPKPKFESRDGWVVKARIKNCDAFATVLVPSPKFEFYRASITGDELILECLENPGKFPDDVLELAAGMLGIHDHIDGGEVRKQTYAKINPIEEDARRQFIFWASTLQQRAFSLGRFATWRPGLLTDDLIQDIRLIDGWIDRPAHVMDSHEMKKRRAP